MARYYTGQTNWTQFHAEHNAERAALDELVALAREGQEYIERHRAALRATEEAIRWTREKLKETGREPIVVTDWKKRAEAAEARADELQGRLYAIENMPPDGYLAINVEAMRPSDELEQARREAEKWRERWERTDDERQARHREADQLRAAVRDYMNAKISRDYRWQRDSYSRLVALAGVQAEEQTTEEVVSRMNADSGFDGGAP